MKTLIAFFLVLIVSTHSLADCLPSEQGVIKHIDQQQIVQGYYTFNQLVDLGGKLFNAKPNACDGAGRPATTGGGEKRSPVQPAFLRTSGPDSNSCSGCHAQPKAGGSGDFVANVFVLAQNRDPVTLSIAEEESNERNTLGMWGAGYIELLAREMTADLQRQAAALSDGLFELNTKGVKFSIEKKAGKVTKAWGIDTDLIVKPFHQSGVVVSLRQFTVNAFNHHHGIQADERFTGDFDEDGIEHELTLGDVTAVTLWQAQLPAPISVVPKRAEALRQVRQGEILFSNIGCANCHTPTLILERKTFMEPNPYNPENTFADTSQSYRFELASNEVHAYTDLKRHNLCDPANQPDAIRFFCNEQLAQGRPDQEGQSGREYFITRKLWDVGNSAPYGHRGDLTTISEAIVYHAGEARASRDRFTQMPVPDQIALVAFLKTLQSR